MEQNSLKMENKISHFYEFENERASKQLSECSGVREQSKQCTLQSKWIGERLSDDSKLVRD